ncbi:hypothetical protein PRIC1_000318 [Phytophthora ramorum]|uniref:Kelch-like protein 17 n=1 Tax=Phytophthora ramorum TaxID=164328 RepID=UPI0030A45BA4|nr:Kelch-like protein 17 [Phytophthora ramorum]KAH7497975.1 Kelch-like protein 17 [Phytophthora ramorum]
MAGSRTPDAASSEDMEREEEEEEDEDSDDEEETQIPIEDQMTQEFPATAGDTSPPPVQRRSPPTSPPLPMAEALAGSPTGPTTANMSPFADVESTPQSNEDEDSRSETSSEVSLGSGRVVRRRGARKRVSTACSDHRNLSERLNKAVACDGEEESFGEAMIGADVVLCVSRSDSRHGANGKANTTSNGGSGAIGVRRFHAHRFILAASSPPFRAMLTGNMRESSRRDVELHDIESGIVEKMLLFMYTGDVVLDLESVLGLLIAAEMYELLALREMCKGFVLKYAHEVFCDPQIVQLPEKILLELIPQDELQIRELALMEALVMWGESRVANADKPLGDLLADMMEFVRFPTMSVSDLYGKVRPLVNDGVIREHLLTEALFNHLKWGSQTGVASKRAKPRALTASLRKRKRVSFTQHVTFETTTQ